MIVLSIFRKMFLPIHEECNDFALILAIPITSLTSALDVAGQIIAHERK